MKYFTPVYLLSMYTGIKMLKHILLMEHIVKNVVYIIDNSKVYVCVAKRIWLRKGLKESDAEIWMRSSIYI